MWSSWDYWKIVIEDENGKRSSFNCTPGREYNHYPTKIMWSLKEDLTRKIKERFLCAEELIIGEEVEVRDP